MSINGSLCKMEVNTAAYYLKMIRSKNAQKYNDISLHSSKVELKTCTGEILTMCGEMQCDIVYIVQKYVLLIIGVNYEVRPTLLGTN